MAAFTEKVVLKWLKVQKVNQLIEKRFRRLSPVRTISDCIRSFNGIQLAASSPVPSVNLLLVSRLLQQIVQQVFPFVHSIFQKRPGSSHSLLDTDHGTEMWANSLDKAWLRLMAALANENMILQHTETVITRTERESPGRAATSDAKSIIDGLEDLITTTVKTSSVKIGIVELKLLFGKFKSFYCYATFDMV